MKPFHAFVLVGPTASGKTAVAQYLAENHGCAILSADSMLVYRGMDIGTAKPSRIERERIRHWGIDMVEVGQPCSVARWLSEARIAVAASRGEQRPLIVVGGTGLYVRCLLQGLEPAGAPDPRVRSAWEERLRHEGLEALQRIFKERAPDQYAALADPRNPRRLVRALEMLDSERGHDRRWNEAGRQHTIAGLLRPTPTLKRRIEDRVSTMYAQGLLEETRALMPRGLLSAPTALQAIGYAEAVAVVEGIMQQEAAQKRTVIRTQQLAKRQMTWFRHQANVAWVQVGDEDSLPVIAAKVWETWQRFGPAPLAGIPGV